MKSKSILAVFVFLMSCLVTGVVVAQPIPDTCDQDFYDVMRARALLEGRREVETAETFILRPDSVLEYSCFNVRVDQLGRAADQMFSDNVTTRTLFQDPPFPFKPKGQFQPEISQDNVDTIVLGPEQRPVRFGPHPPRGISNQTLDTMLGDAVLMSFAQYVGRNFGHRFGGGTLTGAPSGGGTPCSAMNLVWPFLKCVNMPQPSDAKSFFRFEEMLVNEPRLNPVACNEPNRGQILGVNIGASRTIPDGPAGVESVEQHMHLDLFDAANCSASQPILTGVLVYPFPPAGLSPHPDAICVAPGCSYDGQGACN